MALVDIRPYLRRFILEDSAVAALIGTRFYPVKLEQGQTAPSAVYTRIGGTGEYAMEGPLTLVHMRLQIDAYAEKSQTMTDVANAIKFRFDGLRGRIQLPGSPVRIARVQGVFFASERELFDKDSGLYRNSRDYMVHYEERT
jgi:hypothetical protein